MLIRENVPLAPLTTLEVGGPARYFAEARNEADVLEAVEFARSRGLPLFVLGGGSNLVIADAGFVGLVLKVGITDLAQSTASHGQVTFVAGAGYDWDTLVKESVEAGCAGLECLSGIPGTVGGTPVQNVGAYGQEVSRLSRKCVCLTCGRGRSPHSRMCSAGLPIAAASSTQPSAGAM
jgi:UDP-N-acetylmuramate dehydrogenase